MGLTGTKIYFASDFHLGSPDSVSSLVREKAVVAWLEEIRKDAAEIYLVGDIFDFWFEYRHVVPKGYVRLLGKLAEIVDAGIPVRVFTGNHDMWMFDYLPLELGISLHRQPIIREYFGKQYFIGHGDGLGPGDHGYKMIKKIFANPVCQWLFARIHPNLGISMALFWSRKSRKSGREKDAVFNGKEQEWLYHYCMEQLKTHQDIACFIFGHRHLPLEIQLTETSKYINLGDWIQHFTYGIIDADGARLLTYNPIFRDKSTNLAE